MPGRSLPNTHAKRDTAFLTAKNKYDNTPVADRLLTAAQYSQWLDLASAASTYSKWKKEREEAAGALSGQTGLSGDLPALERALRLNVSHFIQTLNNAVLRAVLPASDRALFLLPVSVDAVPGLDAESDLLLWSDRIAVGEAARIAGGGTALAWPSAGQVAAARTAYLAVANPQSAAQDTALEEQRDVLALVPATDLAIKKMWDTIEYNLGQQDLAGSALRSRARQWGVVYEGSAAEDDGGSTPPPTPEPPAAPQNVVISQGNPGDAVEATADAVDGATLYRVYYRTAGGSEAPTLVASAGTLPTSFTTVGPGDWDFTITAANADGEGAPSAAVTFTVQ